MRKNLTKIVIMLGLIFINLFCCSFFQIIFADDGSRPVPDKNNEQLEEIFNSSLSGDTLDFLQYAAKRQKNSFFDFDASKMVKRQTIVDVHGNYSNYYYNHEAVICASPNNHVEAAKQRIDCIMDVTSEGVTVYVNGREIKTPREGANSKEKQAIKYADQLAYFAYKSIEKGETTQNEPWHYYKSIMRFQLLR